MDEPVKQRNEGLEPAQWLQQHGDFLYRYAFARLRDPESSEEVVQDTLLAGLRAHRQFRAQGTERAWLLGILKRKIVDYIRQRARSQALHGTDTADDLSEALFDNKGNWRVDPRAFGTDPQAVLEKKEFWDVFWACLGKLPPRQADVFSLREIDDMSSPDICKDLGITASNLWVLLYRARLGLSRCMNKNWGQR